MGDDNWRITTALQSPEKARELLGELTDQILKIELDIRTYKHEMHLGTASHDRREWFIRATNAHQLAVNDCKRLREFLRDVRIAEHAEGTKPKMTEKNARQIAHAAITYRFRVLDFQSAARNTSREEVENARVKMFRIIDDFKARAE